MKKVTTLLLLSIFLFSTIGVIASSYQCKKPMTVNKSCCQAPDKNCCEKNSKLLKITDHFISASFQLPAKSSLNFLQVFVSIFSTSGIPHTLIQAAFQPGHAPPDPSVDICIFVQSFRI